MGVAHRRGHMLHVASVVISSVPIIVFCIMCKPRFSCSFVSLTRLSTLL